jgi:hypothetical protein
VDVGSIGRTTYKLLSCDCVRVASQDPEEELAASNFLTSQNIYYQQRHLSLLIGLKMNGRTNIRQILDTVTTTKAKCTPKKKKKKAYIVRRHS